MTFDSSITAGRREEGEEVPPPSVKVRCARRYLRSYVHQTETNKQSPRAIMTTRDFCERMRFSIFTCKMGAGRKLGWRAEHTDARKSLINQRLSKDWERRDYVGFRCFIISDAVVAFRQARTWNGHNSPTFCVFIRVKNWSETWLGGVKKTLMPRSTKETIDFQTIKEISLELQWI